MVHLKEVLSSKTIESWKIDCKTTEITKEAGRLRDELLKKGYTDLNDIMGYL